jgi:hypothetical protein
LKRLNAAWEKRIDAAIDRVVMEREGQIQVDPKLPIDEYGKRLGQAVSLLFGRIVKRNDGVLAREYLSDKDELPGRCSSKGSPWNT